MTECLLGSLRQYSPRWLTYLCRALNRVEYHTEYFYIVWSGRIQRLEYHVRSICL